MKVFVFGATGTAGSGILAACLADAVVREVRLLRVSRRLYVTSEDIGRAMVQATLDGRRTGIVENDEIRALSERRRAAGARREA